MSSAKRVVFTSRREGAGVEKRQNTQWKSTQGEDVRAHRKQVAWTRLPFCAASVIGKISSLTWDLPSFRVALQGAPHRLCTATRWEQSPERRWAAQDRQKENVSSPSWVNTESSQLACQQHFWVKAFSTDRHLQQSSLPRSPNHRGATLGWLQHSGNVIPQAPGAKPSPLLPYI